MLIESVDPSSSDPLVRTELQAAENIGLELKVTFTNLVGIWGRSPIAPKAKELSAEQRAQLADHQKQEQYHAQVLEQLRRMQCPGCGENARVRLTSFAVSRRADLTSSPVPPGKINVIVTVSHVHLPNTRFDDACV